MDSLKAIRNAKTLSADEVVKRGREISDSFPETPHALYMIERYGTDRYPVLAALAMVYDMPIETLAVLAKPNPRPGTRNYLSHSA